MGPVARPRIRLQHSLEKFSADVTERYKPKPVCNLRLIVHTECPNTDFDQVCYKHDEGIKK